MINYLHKMGLNGLGNAPSEFPVLPGDNGQCVNEGLGVAGQVREGCHVVLLGILLSLLALLHIFITVKTSDLYVFTHSSNVPYQLFKALHCVRDSTIQWLWLGEHRSLGS